MSESHPSQLPEQLNQLSKQELVEIIVSQQQQIQELTQEIERLKLSQNLDSQTSSKPPSTDLLKKNENNQEKPSSNKQTSTNKKPGGQPGHQGNTRKGFGHIDRYEITRPESCPHCGNQQLNSEPVKIDKQQVARAGFSTHRNRGTPTSSLPMRSLWSHRRGRAFRPTSPWSRLGNEITRIVVLAGKLWTSVLHQTTGVVMGISRNPYQPSNVSGY